MTVSAYPEQKIVRLSIPDSAVLRACYMPFLQRKGLFIPSAQVRVIGDRVFLIVRLLSQNLTVAGMGSVCWVTPKFCSDGREPGFGVHFDSSAAELVAAIESALSLKKEGLDHDLSDKHNTPPALSYTL